MRNTNYWVLNHYERGEEVIGNIFTRWCTILRGLKVRGGWQGESNWTHLCSCRLNKGGNFICRDYKMSARGGGMRGKTVSIQMSVTLLAWKRWPLQTALSVRVGHMFYWLKLESMREKTMCTVYTKASCQGTATAALLEKGERSTITFQYSTRSPFAPWWAPKSAVSQHSSGP